MAFCAAIATAVTLGACGSGIPGNAVVQIGKASISKDAISHWLVVANDQNQLSTGAKAPALPIPPDYTACVKAAEQAAGNTAASRSSAEVSIDKSTCQTNYQTLLTEVLNYLIPEMWIQGEAAKRGFKVTSKAVEASFKQALKTSVPPLTTTKELNSFLAATGETVADLKWRTYVSLLGNKIALAVQKKAAKVTAAAITAYYKKNHAQYTTPETRNIHLVLVQLPATAQLVKSLLAGGESYATVAAKYSIDATTKSKGGEMLGVTSAELTPQLSAKVFAAKVGALSGPVKTAFGYYVFTVDKVVPSKTQTLAQSSKSIKALLSTQQVQAALTALQNDLTKEWTPRTTCREGFQVPDCANNPKGSTSASGTTGG